MPYRVAARARISPTIRAWVGHPARALGLIGTRFLQIEEELARRRPRPRACRKGTLST